MFKVVKEFGNAKKGDLFKYNDETDLYEMSAEDKTPENNTVISRSMAVDSLTMGVMLDNGYILDINECCNTASIASCYQDVIESTVEFIDSLLKQYDSDLNETNRKFDNGEIQPCVKLEAETVYYNLNKVLNAIKEKLTV